MLVHNLNDRRFVPQIDFFKMVLGMAGNADEIFYMAGIGQAIEIHEPSDFPPIYAIMDHVGSNESRSAGNQQVHPGCE